MVTVNYICFVIALFVRGAVSRAQDTTDPPRATTGGYGTFDSYYDYGNYGAYDYSKQYGDYVKQYRDYVSQYGDYVPAYGAAYTDYGAYDQKNNNQQYEDYGYYDDDYSDDYENDYGDLFAFGDRNNPLDTVMQLYEDSGLGVGNEIPWVYIIVPVIQVDVFYVGDETKALEDMEVQFPIETFFFELGNFGLGHFDLGDFGLLEAGLAGDAGDYLQYDDYPTMGHYPNVNLYDTADELSDWTTLDYPGIDHDSFWVDWIFMLPPDEIIR